MNKEQELHKLISTNLACEHLDVHGPDQTHFQALVVSSAFAGKSLIERHKLVYGTLGGRMGSEIHALSLKTLTPEEWKPASE